MIACIIFVFGALLEYTVILLKLKLKKVRAEKYRNGSLQNGESGGSRKMILTWSRFYLRTVGLYGVMNIDKHKKDGH